MLWLKEKEFGGSLGAAYTETLATRLTKRYRQLKRFEWLKNRRSWKRVGACWLIKYYEKLRQELWHTNRSSSVRDWTKDRSAMWVEVQQLLKYFEWLRQRHFGRKSVEAFNLSSTLSDRDMVDLEKQVETFESLQYFEWSGWWRFHATQMSISISPNTPEDWGSNDFST
jgi:hypothetical protein